MEPHASKYFWSPGPLASASESSNSSGEANEEPDDFNTDQSLVAELEPEFYYDNVTLPPFTESYMRNLLRTVNEKWDKEPDPLEERVVKVQFMPEDSLVTITYFSDDEIPEETPVPEAVPVSLNIDNMVGPELTEPHFATCSRFDHHDSASGITEEEEQDAFPDDFLDEEIDYEAEEEDALEKSSGTAGTSCSSILASSETAVFSVSSDALLSHGSGSTSSNLIDLRSEMANAPDLDSIGSGAEEPDERFTVCEKPVKLKPGSRILHELPDSFFEDPNIKKPNYSRFSTMFSNALQPGTSFDPCLDSISSSSSSSESVPSLGPKSYTPKHSTAKANHSGTRMGNKDSKTQIKITMEDNCEIGPLLNRSNNNVIPENKLPQSNPAVELIKKLSQDRLKMYKPLEVNGKKLQTKAEPEVVTELTVKPSRELKLAPSDVKLKPTSSDAKQTPSDVKLTPSSVQLKPTPSDVKPTPSDVKQTPSDVKLTPSSVQLKPTPSDVKQTPSDVKQTPSDVKLTPSGVQLKPMPSDVKLKPMPSDVKHRPTPSDMNKTVKPSGFKPSGQPSQVSQAEGANASSQTNISQASSSSSISLSSVSSEDAHFQAVIQAVFNKKSLVALNKLLDPNKLPQAKAQIAKRNISRTMLSNIFRPDFVRLLFDEEHNQMPLSAQSTGSKWATRPVYKEALDFVTANGDSKDRLLKATSAASFKGMTKKKKVEEIKLVKYPVPNRSVSAKEKVSKLRSTIAKISPRPATTGSKNLNRVNLMSRWSEDSYSGANNGMSRMHSTTNANAIDQTLNSALEKIKLDDEKKANLHNFNNWLDQKKKQGLSKPSALSTDSDRWLHRMKTQTKKAEDEILAKIKTDNNPRMLDAYRAYRYGGPNSPGTAYNHPSKKSSGNKIGSSSTHH